MRTETTLDGNFHLWSVPPPLPPGATTPTWLIDLATICGGKRLTDDGRFDSTPDVRRKIDDVRREIAALPDDSPYIEWGRWFLSDRATRAIAPGFRITSDEAKKLTADLGSRR